MADPKSLDGETILTFEQFIALRDKFQRTWSRRAKDWFDLFVAARLVDKTGKAYSPISAADGGWGPIKNGNLQAINGTLTPTTGPAAGKEWKIVHMVASHNDTAPADLVVWLANSVYPAGKINLIIQAGMASTDARPWPSGTLNAYTMCQGVIYLTSSDLLCMSVTAITAAKLWNVTFWYQERDVPTA